MATCANCIHHSLCDYNTNVSGNGKIRLVYAEGADVKCSFFQNTADVVQKSEVERLQAELDSKQFRCDSCDRIMLTGAEHRACVKQAKAEVAREIFEEIEKWLVHEYVPYIRGYSNSLSRNFDELKKKYTEA